METPEFAPAMRSTVAKDLVYRATSDPNENRGRGLVIVTWLLISISILVVLARCLTKLRYAGKVFHDDTLMIFAIFTGIAHAVFVQLSVDNGYGRHMSSLTTEKMSNTVLFGGLSMLFGAFTAMVGRISFCCTLLFLIKTDPRMRAWPVYLCIFIQIAVNVTGIVVVFTQCGRTMDLMWQNPQQELRYYDYCANPVLQTYMKYVVGAVNTATDLYLAILPAILINHTKMSAKAKLGLASLLCLSILAMVASGAKTYEARFLQGLTDYTWSLVPYTVCTSVELNIIIISASVPLLRPLFQRQKAPKCTLNGDTWPNGKHIALQPVESSQSQKRWPMDLKRDVASPTLTRISSDGIRVTTDIEVSYISRSAPEIHANIIGLRPNSDEFACPESIDSPCVPRRRWWRLG